MNICLRLDNYNIKHRIDIKSHTLTRSEKTSLSLSLSSVGSRLWVSPTHGLSAGSYHIISAVSSRLSSTHSSLCCFAFSFNLFFSYFFFRFQMFTSHTVIEGIREKEERLHFLYCNFLRKYQERKYKK